MPASPLQGEVLRAHRNQEAGQSSIVLEDGLCEILSFSWHINCTFNSIYPHGELSQTINIICDHTPLKED